MNAQENTDPPKVEKASPPPLPADRCEYIGKNGNRCFEPRIHDGPHYVPMWEAPASEGGIPAPTCQDCRELCDREEWLSPTELWCYCPKCEIETFHEHKENTQAESPTTTCCPEPRTRKRIYWEECHQCGSNQVEITAPPYDDPTDEAVWDGESAVCLECGNTGGTMVDEESAWIAWHSNI